MNASSKMYYSWVKYVQGVKKGNVLINHQPYFCRLLRTEANDLSYLLENLNTATTWKITSDFVLSQNFWCHKYWYLQIADIPPNTVSSSRGTKTPLTTILSHFGRINRKQKLSNLEIACLKTEFHNQVTGILDI